MFRKKLVTCINCALIAGGLLLSFSSSAMANSVYNSWSTGYTLPGSYGQYRFRPVAPQRHVRYSYATGRYQQPQRRSNWYNSYSHYRHSPYQGLRFSQPAFVRQYGWAPASKMVVRRVSQSSHYASSSNAYVEQASTAPVYRSAPISTQGFKYRDMTRNAPYVTFSGRVKQFMKMENRFSHQVPAVQHVQIQPVEQQPTQATVNVIRKQHNPGIVGNYKFRPDQRFAPQLPAPQMVARPKPEKSDFRLVGAKLQNSGDNFLDNWSFRPVESTF
ncbi:MAG: hypothetical protein HKP55_15475 [Gammaproteobacteria bacterium]|nr:hypothetical protein [Gammaproteobacteria bacterium]